MQFKAFDEKVRRNIMKIGKKLLAACMSALMLTGVLPAVPMSEVSQKSTLTAKADYADKYLIKIDVLKKMLTDYKVNHVQFTTENPLENNPELELTHQTILNENGDTTAAIVENGGEDGTTLYVYNNNGYTLPAIAPANCSRMFYNMDDLITVDLSGLSFAQTTDLSELFWDCGSLTYVKMPSDTSRVKTMRRMFENCENLTELYNNGYASSVLYTQSVEDFSEMFAYCLRLESKYIQINDTSSAVNMYMMFYDCTALTSIDVSNFDTSNVTSMDKMFYNCKNLTKLDLSSFNTKNVKNFSEMFKYCKELTQLDLSSFDTKNAVYFNEMFAYCLKLTELDLSSFDTNKATHFDGMFDECPKLKSIDISNFTFNPYVNITAIQKFVYLPKTEQEAKEFVPLYLTMPPEYYKAFQFDKNYVKRNYTAIEGIVANGDSMDLDTDGSFKLYVYMNTKDDIFTAPDSQAFLRCTMPDGSVLKFDKKSTAQDKWPCTLNGKMTVCDGFALQIGAKDFDKLITVELYKDANTKLSGSYHFSATQYLEAWKDLYSGKADDAGAPELSAGVKNFINSIENYGVYADAYFNHKSLAATISNPKKYSQNTYKYYVEGENGRKGELQYYYNILCKEIPDENYYGTTLLLENSITLRHYFTEQVPGSKESELNKGLYYLEKSFPAIKLSKGIEGYEYFSVDDYIYFVLKDNERTDEDYIRLKNLCVALAEFQYYTSEYERLYNLYGNKLD